jgi:pilus assembly protein Flp/PilA
MRSNFWKLLSRVQTLMRDDGQDLVEYALMIALIAFGAVAGTKSLAGKINTAFSTIGTSLTTSIT